MGQTGLAVKNKQWNG